VTVGGKTVVVDPALEADFQGPSSQQGDDKQEDGNNAQGRWPQYELEANAGY
jgi:hypothetical protein